MTAFYVNCLENGDDGVAVLVYAETEKEALEKASYMKVNKRRSAFYDGARQQRPSVLLRKIREDYPTRNALKVWSGVMHACVFTAFLAERAGLIKGVDLLKDSGLLHETIHLFHAKVTYGQLLGWTGVERMWKELEEKIPGFLPRKGKR